MNERERDGRRCLLSEREVWKSMPSEREVGRGWKTAKDVASCIILDFTGWGGVLEKSGFFLLMYGRP
jgi:hypothetical protein